MTPERRQEIEGLLAQPIGHTSQRQVAVLRKAVKELLAEIAALKEQVERLREANGILEDDYKAANETIAELKDNCRCPDCGCATIADAESQECGCDAPVCAIEVGDSLAQAYLRARTQLKELVEAGQKVGVDVSRILRVLADWLDREDKGSGYADNSVQHDLRIFADNIDALSSALAKAKGVV